MPWSTPTLRKTREMVRDEITSALSGAAFIGNNVLRVMADAMAGLAHLTLRYIDWLSRQLLPDTAETEWLDRHGNIWLTNADGSTGRKQATYAFGTVTFTGIPDTVVPKATQLTGNGIGYETTEEMFIGSDGGPTECSVRALDPGLAGNAPLRMAFDTPIAGVDGQATVVNLDGGTDAETDAELRMRVLERIQAPPMGGDKEDYVNWTLRVPGVTRAWSFPLEMGIGTCTVRFMMDDLRAGQEGFPNADDVATVQAYLDTVRPVAVKDFFVVAPIRQPIDFYINQLDPGDDSTVKGGIEVSILEMLKERAAPGQTIFKAWKSDAVLSAPGVISFDLGGDDDVMPDVGHLAVLGDIYYGS